MDLPGSSYYASGRMDAADRDDEGSLGLRFSATIPQGCPPADTPDANAECYRITSGTRRSDADFLSYAELGKLPTASPCKRAAISVFDTYQNARRNLQVRPYIGSDIIRGCLEPQHGKLSNPSGSGHMSWWAYENVDRKGCFEEPVA